MTPNHTNTSGIPRTRSMGLRELFTEGPWETPLFCWVFFVLPLAYVLLSPSIRFVMVARWPCAAWIGAAVAYMSTMRVVIRMYGGPDSPRAWLLLGAATVVGAGVFALGSLGPLGPVARRASECAPLVMVTESALGRWSAVLLPLLVWGLWMRHLILGFVPPSLRLGAARSDLSRQMRYDFGREDLKLIPGRVAAAASWTAVALLMAHAGTREVHGAASTSDRIAHLLTRWPVSIVAVETQVDPVEIIETDRLHSQQAAFAALGNLQWDEARPLVWRTVCGLRLPDSGAHPVLLRAEGAFRTLDAARRDKSQAAFLRRTRATVDLLPLRPDASGSPMPPCPAFWPSRSDIRAARPDSLAQLNIAARSLRYGGQTLGELRTVHASGKQGSEPATVEVGIKLVGQTGRDQSLFNALAERLGQPPAEGPGPIGGGAWCAAWDLGDVGIRLGPAVGPQISDQQMTARSPLWLTCYDARRGDILQRIYQKPAQRPSWDPHRCRRF